MEVLQGFSAAVGCYCEKKNVELMLEELKVTTTNVLIKVQI